MGGLITTAGDFARYAIMHLSAWPPRDSAEVMPSRAHWREMHSLHRSQSRQRDTDRRSDQDAITPGLAGSDISPSRMQCG
ncbi:MAG: hypothetical protein R2756_15935 [Bacteroidales bacterium]